MTKLVAKLLVLIAILVMPLGMATAAAPAHEGHNEAAMAMEHCPDKAPAKETKSGFAACTMACAAALPAVDRPGENLFFVGHESSPTPRVTSLQGIHPDIETPPPKRS